MGPFPVPVGTRLAKIIRLSQEQLVPVQALCGI